MKRKNQTLCLAVLVLLVGTGTGQVLSADKDELIERLRGKSKTNEGRFPTRALPSEKSRVQNLKVFTTHGIPKVILADTSKEEEKSSVRSVSIDSETTGEPDDDHQLVKSEELASGGELQISIPKSAKIGERIGLTVNATKDVFVRIYHFSSDGAYTLLYPRETSEDGFRPENKELRISWETTTPGGNEEIVIFAAPKKIEDILADNTSARTVIFERDGIFVSVDNEFEPSNSLTTFLETISYLKISYLLKD